LNLTPEQKKKIFEYQKKWRKEYYSNPENVLKRKEYHKELRELRKKLRRCLSCDRDLTTEKTFNCYKCLERSRVYHNKSQEKKKNFTKS